MENRISKRNSMWIKIGLGWNGVSLLITAVINAMNVYKDGGSAGEAVSTAVFLIVVTGIVLALNIYAYNFVMKTQTRQAVNFAIILGIAAIFSLNIVGTLIIILSYLRIKKHDLVEQEQ